MSNSELDKIETFAKTKHFDLSMFDDIIINEFQAENLSKESYYKKIMEQNNLAPNQILVIGDNYKNDLRPAKKLGMHVFKCEEGFTYDEIMG